MTPPNDTWKAISKRKAEALLRGCGFECSLPRSGKYESNGEGIRFVVPQEPDNIILVQTNDTP